MTARVRRLALAAFSALGSLSAAAGAVESKEVVRRSLVLGPEVRTIDIDNVFGSVQVKAGAEGRVELVIHQTIVADDAEALAAAKREVFLDVVEGSTRLELVQDGAFRDDCDRRCDDDDEKAGNDESDESDENDRSHRRHRHRRSQWDPDYDVDWRWEVTVPAAIALEASNVNGGDLVVAGVTGPVEVSNVNGDVRLTGLGGRASASTVNGELEASFDRPLAAPAEFSTVNGDVTLAFPRPFGAELEFSTLHGDVYTDFDYDSTPSPARVERDGSRYRVGREALVKLGGGGHRLACATVNGDILIRER